MINEIEPKMLFDLMQKKDRSMLVVDVRTIQERKEGYIEGTIHIPVNELPFAAIDLAKENTLYFQCKSGIRSAQACLSLMQLGFNNTVNLKGGILAWLEAGLKIKK